MKAFTLLLYMVTHTLTPIHTDNFEAVERSGKFRGTLDGVPFQMIDDRLHPPTLVTKAGSLDGRVPAQTLINLSFINTGNERNEETLVEGLQFEIVYAPDIRASAAKFTVAMQYNGVSYFPLLEYSQLTVTKLIWDADKKGFEINADFNCTMRSYAHLTDGNKDIPLKGSMAGIRVTVPAWVATR